MNRPAGRRLRVLLAGYAVVLPALAILGGWDYAQLVTGWGLPERSRESMTLVAHRGDLERYPENTLEAIVSATEIGGGGIEFDVQQSADGTWWVLHDRTLDRTTTVSGAVHALSDDEIRRAVIDGGFGYDASRHDGLSVPRLTSVLAALESYEGMVFVDLQHASSADAGALARLVRGVHAAILCRSIEDARAVKAIDPSIKTLMRYRHGTPAPHTDSWLADGVHEATVENVRRAALPVTVYLDEWRFGWDETGAIRRAWAADVEAFLTKDPRSALATLTELERDR